MRAQFKFALLVFIALLMPAGSHAQQTVARKPTIFICGDSTANSSGDIQGWGTPIANYFDLTKVDIANVAHAGTSSRTYYDGDWPKVLTRIQPGDFVLEVFGINDG